MKTPHRHGIPDLKDLNAIGFGFLKLMTLNLQEVEVHFEKPNKMTSTDVDDETFSRIVVEKADLIRALLFES